MLKVYEDENVQIYNDALYGVFQAYPAGINLDYLKGRSIGKPRCGAIRLDTYVTEDGITLKSVYIHTCKNEKIEINSESLLRESRKAKARENRLKPIKEQKQLEENKMKKDELETEAELSDVIVALAKKVGSELYYAVDKDDQDLDLIATLSNTLSVISQYKPLG